MGSNPGYLLKYFLLYLESQNSNIKKKLYIRGNFIYIERASDFGILQVNIYSGKTYLLAYFPKHYVNKKVPKKPGNSLIAPSNLDIYRAGNTENKYLG